MKMNTRNILMFAGAALVGYMAYNFWQRRKGNAGIQPAESDEYSGFVRTKIRNRFAGSRDSGTCPPSCEFPPATSRILSN